MRSAGGADDRRSDLSPQYSAPDLDRLRCMPDIELPEETVERLDASRIDGEVVAELSTVREARS